MVTRNPRHAVRLANEYFLRQILTLSDLFNGDLILGLVFTGVAAANNRHLLHKAEILRAYPGLMDVPPDDLRAPISIAALARSLGLPFETTRRHVNRLIKMKACTRTHDGLILNEAFLLSEGVVELVNKVNVDLRVFIATLRRETVILDNLE